MVQDEFKYRGKTLEELQGMTHKELAELLPSKQRRKIQRGFTDDEKNLIEKLREKDNVKTHLRSMIVLPEWVGKTISIHKGNSFKAIEIQPEMIGHYLGELNLSRKRIDHSAPGIGATRSTANISVR